MSATTTQYGRELHLGHGSAFRPKGKTPISAFRHSPALIASEVLRSVQIVPAPSSMAAQSPRMATLALRPLGDTLWAESVASCIVHCRRTSGSDGASGSRSLEESPPPQPESSARATTIAGNAAQKESRGLWSLRFTCCPFSDPGFVRRSSQRGLLRPHQQPDRLSRQDRWARPVFRVAPHESRYKRRFAPTRPGRPGLRGQYRNSVPNVRFKFDSSPSSAPAGCPLRVASGRHRPLPPTRSSGTSGCKGPPCRHPPKAGTAVPEF